MATQPKMWERLRQHHGAETRERFLRRLANELGRRGGPGRLPEGRQGLRVQVPARPTFGRRAGSTRRRGGCTRRTCSPSCGSFGTARRRGGAWTWRSSSTGSRSSRRNSRIPSPGRAWGDAIRQYRHDRDPREPLLAHRRCLAHFAVDPELVYVTTRLEGGKTRFLPFNRGRFGGAGNPPVPPDARRLRHGIPVARGLGAEQRPSISSASSFTRSR